MKIDTINQATRPTRNVTIGTLLSIEELAKAKQASKLFNIRIAAATCQNFHMHLLLA